MDAGAKQLADILNGSRVLEVPYYQRSYVWKEEQWDRFLSDMEYITSTGKDYFLGSIILKQQPTGISPFDLQTIIDGQQRFTTLALFFKCLCLKTDDLETFERNFTVRDRKTKERSSAIRHSINDRKDFEETRKQLDEVFSLDYTHTDARLLHGQWKLSTNSEVDDTNVWVGDLSDRTIIRPGQELTVSVQDRNLGIAGGGNSIPIVVTTSAGKDRELLSLRQIDLSRYNGTIPFLLSGGIGLADAAFVKSLRHPLFVGIDLNECFETAPAVKDIEKLRRFIHEVKPNS